jgi:hypothetical protein
VSRNQYKSSIRLNLDETQVNLIPVIDSSPNSLKREQEVITLVAEMIRLASKRGRVSNNNAELLDEAA